MPVSPILHIFLLGFVIHFLIINVTISTLYWERINEWAVGWSAGVRGEVAQSASVGERRRSFKVGARPFERRRDKRCWRVG
jgi:hypothetical protein